MREVEFINTQDKSLRFRVFRVGDKIGRIVAPSGVDFPFKVGDILDQRVIRWACNNRYLINRRNPCSQKIEFADILDEIKQIAFSEVLDDDLKISLIEEFADWSHRPKSSNVRALKWNDETLEVVVEFWNRTTYTYFNVPRAAYFDLINKTAKCVTDGSNKRGRWWVGKPSVGAGVTQILEQYNYQKGGRI